MNQSELSRSQLYKTFRLIADYFLRRNNIKLDRALFQRRYLGYLAQTVSLGFPNKVCAKGMRVLQSTVSISVGITSIARMKKNNREINTQCFVA